jgi:hypothetical protein
MIPSFRNPLSFLAVGLVVGLSLACAATPDPVAVDPLEDSDRQRAMVDAIGAALAGPMKERQPEAALLVDLDELYEPLTSDQRAFMEAIRHLDGADPTRGEATEIDWVRVEGQDVTGAEREQVMGLQLLPPQVWAAFRKMNEALKTDVGRGLVIGSGYRTPANQLSIFVTYMPFYGYSVERTVPHVSLPGASDHNRPERQGMDFVSESGVDLRYSDPIAFKALDEYRWLVSNAERFGFEGEGPDSESPWHWHFIDAGEK